MKNNIIRKILFFATVPKCVCCRRKLEIDEAALCNVCHAEYLEAKERSCSSCFKKLPFCKCVNGYLERHMVHKLIKVFRYKPSSDPNEHVAANELIYNIKRDRRVDLLNFIGDEMAEAIKHSIDPEKYIITNVPRKKSRVLHYGLDHAEEIAKNISKKLGIPYVSLLVSKSRTAQKKVRGEERIKNASFDQRRGAKDVTGKRIILVDDIVTTGASMGAAAMMIRAMGAKEVVGACLAITFNDKYTPFIKTEY